MQIANCSAVVTGAASGLGAATARLLAEAGVRVALFDLNAAEGGQLARELGGVFAQVDVADEASVNAGLDMAARAQGEARILVNCAGVIDAAKTTSKGMPHPLPVFERIIRINLIGTFNCIRLAATRMAALHPLDGGERGVIVSTASVAAYDGQMGQAAYAASKSAVAGMTLPIARDLARVGIRVMAIAPGIFETAMVAGLPSEVQSSLHASVPFPPRLGAPAEYAALVKHICENSYLNGEVIRLDGAIRMPPR